MVSKKAKLQMAEFITNALEESGLYQIVQVNNSDILVVEKPELFEQPKTINILAHAGGMTKEDATKTVRDNAKQRVFTGHVFYKDGRTFMVRLGKRAQTKGNDRSLKKYLHVDRNKMIHLRALEKLALGRAGDFMLYYQPATERLEGSIRAYRAKDVWLDYSHVDEFHRSFDFVENRQSLDYRLMDELPEHQITGPAKIGFLTQHPRAAYVVKTQKPKPNHTNRISRINRTNSNSKL